MADVSWAIICLTIVGFHSTFNRFIKEFKLKQQIRKQFEKYLDPRQVAILVKNPEKLKLGGERKEMSFLFMDIVGFTPISEYYKNKDDPEGLVKVINDYLNRMSIIVMKNGGTIDKYMSDCIMAFWNAPLDCENHAEMAVKTAIECAEETDKIKAEFKERGFFYQCTTEGELSSLLDKKKIRTYIGFDCTAKSLHVGSLLQIMCLRLLQKHGHRPIVLLGWGTTRIGDPSGKDKTRKILTETEIERNIKSIEKILKKFHNKNRFVKILPIDSLLSTNDVINTNNCLISVCNTKFKNKIIILSVIDNLIKGGAGQAVQNMNAKYNFKYYEGFRWEYWF